MIDIVRQLRDGEVTDDAAQAIFDSRIAAIQAGDADPEWREAFGLTNHEATAVLLGASLQDLVMLRYGGWPERCELCGQPLDYLTYGWLVEREPGGALAIVHVVCPTRAQQLQGQGPSR